MEYSFSKQFLRARSSVFAFEANGERVYVKQRRPGKNPLGRAAQEVLHRLTGNRLLLAPPGPGGDNVSFEAGMLRRLAEAGIRVPRVLHQEADFFVMSDAGYTMEEWLGSQPERAGFYLERAAGALRRLHDFGFAHGGPQIRNFTFRDGEVHFIDFEDDIPAERLADFQLRDVFIFLLSLERIGLKPDPGEICRLYDKERWEAILAEIAKGLLGMRVARVLETRLLSRLSMSDVRSLLALIRRTEPLALAAQRKYTARGMKS